MLFKEGDHGSKFYIILKGQVKLFVDVSKPGFSEKAEIAQLQAGNSFGELALIKNQPRRATIICNQNSYFMTLCKEDYLRILGQTFAKKLDEKVNFLHSLKIFSNWSKKSLEKLSFFFSEKEYKANEILYKKNDEPDGVYIIINGEVEFTVNKKFKSSEFPKMLKVALITSNDIFGDEEILLDLKRKYTAKCHSKILDVL